jgi:uncharacterized membrane protein YqjE
MAVDWLITGMIVGMIMALVIIFVAGVLGFATIHGGAAVLLAASVLCIWDTSRTSSKRK